MENFTSKHFPAAKIFFVCLLLPANTLFFTCIQFISVFIASANNLFPNFSNFSGFCFPFVLFRCLAKCINCQ